MEFANPLLSASRRNPFVVPEQRLRDYRESFRELKGNKQVCETTVRLPQKILLADRQSMDDILEAIRKIQAGSAALRA